MTKRGQIWKCEVCGNIVEILHDGADALVCCGQPMKYFSEESSGEYAEKHAPVIEGKSVRVGTIPHPMESEHYIEWVEATSVSGEIAKVFLGSGDEPRVDFDFEPVSARMYCNIHGLWKSNE